MSHQTWLYHEKQVAALCGVHCLNTLLQGPYFTELDLAEIAHQLDALERQVMEESGVDSVDYLKYMAEDSGNVAADGMFSIQVLSKALQSWGLQAISLDAPEGAIATYEPQREQAYICNLEVHWFTIRQVDGDWWNFNSLFTAPQHTSAFHLAAFLGSLREQGYTIFVVRGTLPEPHARSESTSRLAGPGQWFTPDQARAAQSESEVVQKRGKVLHALETALEGAMARGGTLELRTAAQRRADELAAQSGADSDLAAAIAASLAGVRPPGSSSGAPALLPSAPLLPGLDADDDANLAAAIAASLADMEAQSRPPQQPAMQSSAGALAAALAESSSTALWQPQLPPAQPLRPGGPPGPGMVPAEVSQPDFRVQGTRGAESAAPSGVIALALRLPSGQRVTQSFQLSDTLGAVAAFLSAQGVEMQRYMLVATYPRKVLSDPQSTLSALGLSDRQLISVEPLSQGG